MQIVILYCFFSELWIGLAQKLVIYSDAVIGQGLAMAIIDALTYLQKFKIILDGFLMFFNIVIEYSNRIIRSTLISNFSSPPTPKSQHLIVLQSPHHSDMGSIINLLLYFFTLILNSLVEDGMFLECSGRCVEEQWQLYSMRLGRCHRSIISLFIKTPNLILFSQ